MIYIRTICSDIGVVWESRRNGIMIVSKDNIPLYFVPNKLKIKNININIAKLGKMDN
jgi:hypothetical protein